MSATSERLTALVSSGMYIPVVTTTFDLENFVEEFKKEFEVMYVVDVERV